jgi:hypothetical protein
VDEARILIRRLERIEALQRSAAPAEELLREVRQLLAEGEAWLAVEPAGSRTRDADLSADPSVETATRAAAALDCCRTTMARRSQLMPKTGDATFL